MCGRFYIESDDTPDELMSILKRADELLARTLPDQRLPRGEVRPGDIAAVISLNRKQQQIVFPMRWGYQHGRKLIINARSETASERPMFRQSFIQRRCLIPASAYFEWDHRSSRPEKLCFRHLLSSTLYIAGLYRYDSPDTLPEFTILTRSAAEHLAVFHDRMPVILPPEAHAQWLDPNANPSELLSRAISAITYQSA